MEKRPTQIQLVSNLNQYGQNVRPKQTPQHKKKASTASKIVFLFRSAFLICCSAWQLTILCADQPCFCGSTHLDLTAKGVSPASYETLPRRNVQQQQQQFIQCKSTGTFIAYCHTPVPAGIKVGLIRYSSEPLVPLQPVLSQSAVNEIQACAMMLLCLYFN